MEDQVHTLEHTRMATVPGTPKNAPSWFLAANRRHIRETMPEIRRLIAYVDGSIHTGVSYRADNWREISRTVQSNSWGNRPGRVGRACAIRVKFERLP
jgi:mitochondrial fission protein ELM1